MESCTLTATSNLSVETKAGVVYLMLNRPEKRNALSVDLLRQMESVLMQMETDTVARVIVLGARGPAFCSGHDLKEMVGGTEQSYHELFALCSRVMQQFRRLPQPVIARVHGLATAAGCQLVAACDLAVAAEEATFATPGVKIGLFCTTPMVPLVRTIAPRAALEMLLTGKPISAQRAFELGLVNRLVPMSELDQAVEEYVNAILTSSPLTLHIGKKAFYRQLALDESTAYDRDTEVTTANGMCNDAQEGIAAFLQERPHTWRGK